MNMLIEILAFCCVLGGSTGMGCWYIHMYNSRIWQMDQLLQLLEGFRQEITYSHIPLAQICRELGERVEKPYCDLLQAFYRRIIEKKGENIATIWKEEVKRIEDATLLTKEGLQLLYQLMDPIGYADSETQVKKIDMLIEKMREALQKQKREQENKVRVYFTVGIMGGLLLGILFL